ncbi:hypothetical protein OS189_08325 [Sulfitobacter sp. F26169L]|uniref:hypothetical protein n=1 Tax=Sulfitobacter sp. F26169L TaxID=2996015 RepID=UPI002260A23B|nr:hypothetical protein [Sulfitobacter sp. F26169L]MCX7566347.1 hypothetical protein [Sulfitobacter sp. F26169L]
MTRIRSLSLFAMIVMLPMIIYYPYEALAWNLELSSLDPERWTRNDRWVDPDAHIAVRTRVVFFTVWVVPIFFGTLSYLVVFSTLILLLRGVMFDPRIAHRLPWMGLLAFLSSTTALFAGAVNPMIRSSHNAGGAFAPAILV